MKPSKLAAIRCGLLPTLVVLLFSIGWRIGGKQEIKNGRTYSFPQFQDEVVSQLDEALISGLLSVTDFLNLVLGEIG